MNKWENDDSDKFQALYSGYNQQEVAPLKNIFFLAVLKLDMKDSFGCNYEIGSMGKTFPMI